MNHIFKVDQKYFFLLQVHLLLVGGYLEARPDPYFQYLFLLQERAIGEELKKQKGTRPESFRSLFMKMEILRNFKFTAKTLRHLLNQDQNVYKDNFPKGFFEKLQASVNLFMVSPFVANVTTEVAHDGASLFRESLGK